MTPSELAQLLRDNPDVAIIPERHGPTSAQEQARKHAVSQRQREIAAEPSEEESQAAVIAWADAQSHPALRWLFHVPNGGARDIVTAAAMKRAGVRRGVPDLLLPWKVGDSPGLAIEMKRRPNRPSDEQCDWLEHLAWQGWKALVCYSADEAIQVIREYLDIA